MTHEQIEKLFELMSRCTSNTRDNIRTFYLDRIDDRIIDYCIRFFQKEKNAVVRTDYLGFMLRYAKTHRAVTDFARQVLTTDKSKAVRHKALSILAFSTQDEHLELLESSRAKLKGNEEDIENAINAIKRKNHNLFYPAYDRWSISRADRYAHLKKEQFTEDVKLYIEKYAKEAVPELKIILGSLYE